jgi:hypothetical protein
MSTYPFSKALQAGLLVGSLDISAAFIHFYSKTGKGPTPILKYIASAVFGKEAYTGGNEMVALGLAFHYIIAFGFTFFFFWLFRQWPLLSKNRILTGILYGIFMWAFMQFIVLPLSNIPGFVLSIKPVNALIAIGILIVCIGIPLALLAQKKNVASS